MTTYFNKKCITKKLKPTEAKIKFPNVSPAHIYTKQNATSMRIKDEVRYLHCKKQASKPADLQSTPKISGFLFKFLATHTARK